MIDEITVERQPVLIKGGSSLMSVLRLTGAVRDLHVNFPGRFATGVDTPFPMIWENNPFLSSIPRRRKDTLVIDSEYRRNGNDGKGAIFARNDATAILGDALDLRITSRGPLGDVHLSSSEKSWISQVAEIFEYDMPFWIISVAGKRNSSTKVWALEKYQRVVDHFMGRVLFVQVGDLQDGHPRLNNVVDLLGKTTLRQLVRLIYHSSGVVCPATGFMGLTGAIEPKRPQQLRPCIVVAGGSADVSRDIRPGQHVLHTIAALPCCATGACNKERVTPVGDGGELDTIDNLCRSLVEMRPRCMEILSAGAVIERLETCLAGGIAGELTYAEKLAALEYLGHRSSPRRIWVNVDARFKKDGRLGWTDVPTPETFASRFNNAAANPPDFPAMCRGRGIVVAGGGPKYLVNAWVLIRTLRHLGCDLPIEFWHIGKSELPEVFAERFGSFNVVTRDAESLSESYPIRILNGWTLKAYCLAHSAFEQILLLDSDNVPVINPQFLFDDPRFVDVGAVFWPDYTRLSPLNPIWEFLGLAYVDDREFESGQILVDKRRCWKSLTLALWLNNYPESIFDYVLGDKETFHLAFLKTKQKFLMPTADIESVEYRCMCQHDLDGRRLFQHRNGDKWMLFSENRRLDGFLLEEQCRRYIHELRDDPATRRYLREQVVPEGEGYNRRLSKSGMPTAVTLIKAGAFSFEAVFHEDGIVISNGVSEEVIFWVLSSEQGRRRLLLYGWKGQVAALTLKGVEDLPAGPVERWEGVANDNTATPFMVLLEWTRSGGSNIEHPSSEEDDLEDSRLVVVWSDGKAHLVSLAKGGGLEGLSSQGIGFWKHLRREGRRLLVLERPFGKYLHFELRGAEEWSFCDEDNAVKLLRLDRGVFSSACVDHSQRRVLEELDGFVASQRWFESPMHRDWSARLRETARYHRLQWEYTAILEVLRDRGMLASRRRGLCLVSMAEPITSLIVNSGCLIKLHLQAPILERFVNCEERSHIVMDVKSKLNDRGLCRSQEFWESVSEFCAEEHIDSRNKFDFLYGVGALNIIYQSEDAAALLGQWLGVLSAKGVAVLTGDLLLFRDKGKRDDESEVPEYPDHTFWETIKEDMGRTGWKMIIPTSADSETGLDQYVDSPPYSSNIHYKLQNSDAVLTSSLILCIKD